MPDIYLDVDAALAEVPVNILPLCDSSDFLSIEGAISYNASGIALRWHFITTAGAYTVTSVTPTTGGVHDWVDQGDSGIYTIEIPASGGTINNDTEGHGWFTGSATGILPWRGPCIGFRAAGINDALIDSAWDANRGLAGAALPAAAADAAGGLAISDAGGLDIDAILADTNSLQTEWANGGRLDLLLDAAGNLDPADVRAAVGLAAANLDTQLSAINVGSILGTAITETTSGSLAGNFSAYIGAGGAAAAENINTKFFTTAEKNQIRYMIGIDGTTAAPASNTPALATAANQTTILNRLGAWTGTGVNTILGGFKALLSKTATAPSDIGGTFAPADDSVEAIRDRGDAEWTSGGGGSTTDWTSDEREEIRYRLGIDGTATAPSTGTPTLPVNVTLIEGADPSDTINAAADAAIADASLATAAALTTSQGVITTAISGLNDISAADVNTQCDASIVDAALATAASLTTVNSGLTTLINGLNDISATDVGTQVDAELAAHGAATSTNVTDAVTALQASITAGHTTADAATAAELTATQTAITTAISGLNDLSAADVNTQCDAAIVDASLVTAAALTTSQGVITTAISGLNNISAADVNTQCDSAIVDASLATAASLTTAISGLNDLSAADVNSQCDSAIVDASLATAAALTTSQGVITTAISALNDLSEAQVNTQVDLGITDAALATAASLTAARTSIENDIAGLQDVSLTSIGTQVASELSTHGAATSTNVSDSQTAITTAIGNLDDVSSGVVTTAVTSALTSYDAATGTDVTTSTSTIQTAISGLSDGSVSCAVTGVAQQSGRVTLKRGNPSTLVFTVAAIAMDDVLLGIRDIAGNSMLKIAGTIDSATQCTFNISASAALNLIDGDDHNLDVFEVDGYNSSTGAYTDAKHLASSPVTVQPLYLRLETN